MSSIPTPERSSLTGEAVFGAFDGLMTSLGVVLGAAHAPTRLILEVALCVSVTGALSMGAGTLLADDEHGWREGLVMGVATLLGTFVPAVPILLLPLRAALIVTGLLSCAVAAGISQARGGTRRDFVTTFAVLVAVAVPTIGVALAFGSTP